MRHISLDQSANLPTLKKNSRSTLNFTELRSSSLKGVNDFQPEKREKSNSLYESTSSYLQIPVKSQKPDRRFSVDEVRSDRKKKEDHSNSSMGLYTDAKSPELHNQRYQPDNSTAYKTQ
jgi:hypothetical protein